MFRVSAEGSFYIISPWLYLAATKKTDGNKSVMRNYG